MAEKTRKALVLQPHQRYLQKHLPHMRFPFYIYWGMGSGKTIAGCLCMQLLCDGDKALVVCDKSTVAQWQTEIERITTRNADLFHNITVQVIHYEGLQTEHAPNPGLYQMVVVDEAHRFRNAWSRDSARMKYWMELIQRCARVVYLSGTPIVHNADTEMEALGFMMGASPLQGRFSYYNPRDDMKADSKYAQIMEENIECPMSWAQCFKYLLHRKQEFRLKLEGENGERVRTSSNRNTYNVLLRSISNVPFCEDISLSPKLQSVIIRMKDSKEMKKKQIVYSSRKDSGVHALKTLWSETLPIVERKHIFCIDGSMTFEKRADAIVKFNKRPRSVLFITDAGGQGIDLKRVDVVHILEPSENIQEERQVINRAVRFKAHATKDAIVHVYRYIAVFPRRGSVEFPWKRELYASGMFTSSELVGITRRVQYSLMDIIQQEEKGKTVDERILEQRMEREIEVQRALQKLSAYAIENDAKDATDAKGATDAKDTNK